ncbi:hypothetical protein F4820DRAFT_193497 [Hypoxylon rubiginosum]|uniref:Uncharacterized protein n=1 Tax=Hypoxylon rubiginosum TaxID=110542 RepID=A0ACB9YHR2_9PEZI|nr:hypothetical protein F4820DRAFT_193497 [Hypoxylon rubiginosum]
MPLRPLHHQLLLDRDVVIAEQMDLHLVWTPGRIFLKPLPPFLLEPRFWRDQLACKIGCDCSYDSERLLDRQRETPAPASGRMGSLERFYLGTQYRAYLRQSRQRDFSTMSSV